MQATSSLAWKANSYTRPRRFRDALAEVLYLMIAYGIRKIEFLAREFCVSVCWDEWRCRAGPVFQTETAGGECKSPGQRALLRGWPRLARGKGKAPDWRQVP